MSTALSGGTARLGESVRAGVLAAFQEINLLGGVRNRRLELVVLDDGYEPARTGPNMESLLSRSDTLAVIGNVGTPTAVAAIPVARQYKALLFGAVSGAGVLRPDPPDPCIINFRASYRDETEAIVHALVDLGGLEPRDIAFLTQRDAFGDAGFAAGCAALKARGIDDFRDIAHGRYERNTTDVENALADLLSSPHPPRAVIMAATAAPAARFVSLARSRGLHAVFVGLSFSGVTELASLLKDEQEDVYASQVVPSLDSSAPIVTRFRSAMDSPAERSNPTALEGYIIGRIMIAALARTDGAPTRAGLVNALESLGEFDPGLGVSLHLSHDDHQACRHVWAACVHRGWVHESTWESLAEAGSRASQLAP